MQKIKTYWVPIFAFLLPFILYGDIFFGRSFGLECATGVMGFNPPYNQNIPLYNKNPYCLFISDIGSYAWNGAPLSIKSASEYKSLRFPIWNQNVAAGAPLAADFLSNSYFIPNIFFAAFRSVFWLDFYFVFRMAVISLGMYLFLRSFKLPSFIALVGSLVTFLNGYITYLPTIQHHNVDILLPWIALLINKSFSTKKIKYFVLLALAAGMSHLGGMPESSVFVLLFYTAYTAFISLVVEKKGKLRLFAMYVFTFGISLFIAGILIIPGYEFISYGKNPHELGIAQQYSIHIKNIFFVLFPRMFGTLGETNGLAKSFNFSIWVLEYIGTVSIFTLILTPIFIFLKRKILCSKLYFKYYLFFFLFLCIMFLQYFGFIHFPLIEKFPGFSQSNFPKYSLNVVNLLIATIVAFTLYYYLELKNRINNLRSVFTKHISIFISISLLFLLILFTYIYFRDFVIAHNIYKHFIKNFIFVIAVLFASSVIFLLQINKTIKYLLFFLLVAGELFLLLPHKGDMKRYDSFKKPPAIETIQQLDVQKFRIYSPDYIIYPNYSSIFNINDIRNLDAVWINTYHKYVSEFITDPVNYRFTGDYEAGSTTSAKFVNNVYLDLLSVKYVLSYKNINAYEDSFRIKSYLDQVVTSPSIRSDIFAIGRKTRPVLFEHPPSKITLTINKPIGASYYYLYPAMSPNVYNDPTKGDGVTFNATVLNGNKILFENTVTMNPKLNKADEKWFEIKLGPFPKGIINFQLILETNPLKTSAWDWAGWGGFEWDTEKSKEKKYQYIKIYDNEMKIYQNTHFISRLHPISKIKCAQTEQDVITQMKYLNSNMREVGVVLSKDCQEKEYDNKDFTIRNETFDDQKVTFTYSSPTEAYVILSNTFYPGWKLKINGQDKPIELVNYTFQGLNLPKGNNVNVEIIYDPFSFKLGLTISVVSLGFCSFVIIKFRNKKIIN